MKKTLLTGALMLPVITSLTLLASVAALAQQSDWTFTVGAPSGWQVMNRAVNGSNFTFSLAPVSSVAFEGAGGGASCDNVAICSWTYTVNAASNALLIEVGGDGEACWGQAGRDDITSVTFDGVAAALLAKRTDNVGQRSHYVYGLLNPHTGAHTVMVTSSNAHQFRTSTADYANVSGFGAAVAHDHGAGSCATDTVLTTSLTTSAPNSVVYLGVLVSAADTAAGAGATARGNNASYVWSFDSSGPIATAGAYSMTVNAPSSGQSMSHVAVELKN